MMRPKLGLKRLPHGEGLPLPGYQSADAAGFDLPAAIPEGAPIVLAPGARMLVPTGFAFMLEAGFEGTREPWDAFWGQRYAELVDPDG